MSSLMEIVLATRNPGKVAELRDLLSELPVRLRAASDVAGAPDVEEDAPTLQGNAHKKAEALHEHTGLPALADDTGLEVEALGGAPGVHTARFAGPAATDAENRVHLLKALQGKGNRRARFRTVIAFVEEDDTRFIEGVCRGHIAREERGEHGFGYDRLFVPEGEQRTFAEMRSVEKNAISHRSRALQQLAAELRNRLDRDVEP